MEPATKQDLKDLLMEFREEFRRGIREAVAAGFGNSKPALEQATTPAASQLLSTDAPASPTTIVDVVPVLAASFASAKSLDFDAMDVAAPTPTSCLTDGLNHNADGDDHMAAWQATWSVPTTFTMPQEASPTLWLRLFVALELDIKAPARCLMRVPVEDSSAETHKFTHGTLLDVGSTATSVKAVHSEPRPLPWPSFASSQGAGLRNLGNTCYLNSVLPPATGSSDIVEIDIMCWVPSIPGEIMGSSVAQPPWPPPQIAITWLSCKGIYSWRQIELKSWPDERQHQCCGVMHPRPPLQGFGGNLPLDELQEIFGNATGYELQECSCNGPRGTNHATPESQMLHLLGNLSFSTGCITAKDQCNANVQHAGVFSCALLWHEQHNMEIALQVLVYGSVLTLFSSGSPHSFRVAELREDGSQLKCTGLTQCLTGELFVEVAISHNIGIHCFLEIYNQEEPFSCFGTGCVQPRGWFSAGTKCRNYPGSIRHAASKHLAIILVLGFGYKPNSNGFSPIQDGIPGASDIHLYAEKQQDRVGELSMEGTKSCTACTLINFFLLEEAEYYWIPCSSAENCTCVEADLNFYLETLASGRKHWKTIHFNSCWGVRSVQDQWYYLWYLEFYNEEKVVSCSCTSKMGMIWDPGIKSVYTVGIQCPYFLRTTLSGLSEQVFEPDGRSRVEDCNAVVHLELYHHQPSHTDTGANLVMTMVQQHLIQNLYGLSVSNGSPTNFLRPLHQTWDPGGFLFSSSNLIISQLISADMQESDLRHYHMSMSWDLGGLALLLLPALARRAVFQGRRCAVILVAHHPAQNSSIHFIGCRGSSGLKVLQVPWDPGGWEFFEYSMLSEAKGGRNIKSRVYCVDQFFCFDLTFSSQQVPVDHKFYFDFDVFRADNEYYLDDGPFFDLAQVYFANGYHHDYISTKECSVSMGPRRQGVGIGLGSSRVSRREEC